MSPVTSKSAEKKPAEKKPAAKPRAARPAAGSGGEEILVAKTSAVFVTADGQRVRVTKGRTTIRRGHPYLRGREHLFQPFKLTFDVEVQA